MTLLGLGVVTDDDSLDLIRFLSAAQFRFLRVSMLFSSFLDHVMVAVEGNVCQSLIFSWNGRLEVNVDSF